jgi:hypothetical protein
MVAALLYTVSILRGGLGWLVYSPLDHDHDLVIPPSTGRRRTGQAERERREAVRAASWDTTLLLSLRSLCS